MLMSSVCGSTQEQSCSHSGGSWNHVMECCLPTPKLPFVPSTQVCPSEIHFSWNLQVHAAVVHHVHGPLLREDATKMEVTVAINDTL